MVKHEDRLRGIKLVALITPEESTEVRTPDSFGEWIFVAD